MDAFFTIAPAVPETVEDQPLETILVESDRLGTNGSHGSCVIA
ncbi:pheromone precursor [Trametes sanguinea]|nr:pheromone precursor [Trametes sanguinea]